MLAATILTLLFVPVFYAVIEGLRERGHSDEKFNVSELAPYAVASKNQEYPMKVSKVLLGVRCHHLHRRCHRRLFGPHRGSLPQRPRWARLPCPFRAAVVKRTNSGLPRILRSHGINSRGLASGQVAGYISRNRRPTAPT